MNNPHIKISINFKPIDVSEGIEGTEGTDGADPEIPKELNKI
jgi:hypothetical protein